jgi:hypothetical protein
MQKVLHLSPECLDELAGTGFGETDHVNDNIWFQVAHARPKCPCLFLGIAVGNHLTDSFPDTMGLIGFPLPSRDVDDFIPHLSEGLLALSRQIFLPALEYSLSTLLRLGKDLILGVLGLTHSRLHPSASLRLNAGKALLVSVLLRPQVPPPRLPELTLVAGEAVAAAIKQLAGLEPAIKLPNDVLVRGRKVAGILAESSEGRVVLGIGVNANQTAEELPSEAQTEPTSLLVELGRTVDRAALLTAVLAELEVAYDRWLSGTGASG